MAQELRVLTSWVSIQPQHALWMAHNHCDYNSRNPAPSSGFLRHPPLACMNTHTNHKSHTPHTTHIDTHTHTFFFKEEVSQNW